jgi:hypothetical protein
MEPTLTMADEEEGGGERDRDGCDGPISDPSDGPLFWKTDCYCSNDWRVTSTEEFLHADVEKICGCNFHTMMI